MNYNEVLEVKELVEGLNEKRTHLKTKYSVNLYEFAPGSFSVSLLCDACVYPVELVEISRLANERTFVWFIGAYENKVNIMLQ